MIQCKAILCGVSSYQFSCSVVVGRVTSQQVEAIIGRPGGVVGSLIDKIYICLGGNIVTTGEVVATIIATTDQVTISSVIISWLIQFDIHHT